VTATPTPRTQLPPRLLPVLYFGVAHVALALAFGAVAMDPRGVSGFFYHARMLGIVHLITLGWITASILGALYLVGPIALRIWIPATWLDMLGLRQQRIQGSRAVAARHALAERTGRRVRVVAVWRARAGGRSRV
jgi:hypothetical protein